MTKLSGSQQAAVNKVRALREKRTTERQSLRERIEAEFQVQLLGLEVELSQAVNEAVVREKVPKTQVQRALGTSNWDSLQKLMSLTSGDFSGVDAAPREPLFEYLRMVDRIRSEGYYIAEVRYLPTGEKWNVRGFFNSFDLFDYATEDKAMACGMVERREDRTFTEIPEDVQEELRQVTGHKQIWDKYR